MRRGRAHHRHSAIARSARAWAEPDVGVRLPPTAAEKPVKMRTSGSRAPDEDVGRDAGAGTPLKHSAGQLGHADIWLVANV